MEDTHIYNGYFCKIFDRKNPRGMIFSTQGLMHLFEVTKSNKKKFFASLKPFVRYQWWGRKIGTFNAPKKGYFYILPRIIDKGLLERIEELKKTVPLPKCSQCGAELNTWHPICKACRYEKFKEKQRQRYHKKYNILTNKELQGEKYYGK